MPKKDARKLGDTLALGSCESRRRESSQLGFGCGPLCRSLKLRVWLEAIEMDECRSSTVAVLRQQRSLQPRQRVSAVMRGEDATTTPLSHCLPLSLAALR